MSTTGAHQVIDFDQLGANFRRDLPSALTSGRRFLRGLEHASLKMESAEECLTFIRLGWRPLFEAVYEVLEEDGEQVPEVLDAVKDAWELLESLIFQLLDRRGTQNLEELNIES